MNQNKQLVLGKVNRNILERSVLFYLPIYRKPMLDSNIFMKDIAISHNPALGVPLYALGFFAFHYVASNIAVSFTQPKYMIIGIYLPPKSTEEELETITKNFGEEARKYKVKIVSGHTGVYKGLNIPIVSATCFGQVIRKPEKPSINDLILVAGDIGKEAVWLKSLKDKEALNCAKKTDIDWKLTPLSLANSLIRVKGVKLMHDVSEGGIAGALYEAGKSINLKLGINSNSMKFYKGAKDLGEDILRIPSYGSLIVIADESHLSRILKSSEDLGYSCAIVGRLKKGRGTFIDGIRIEGIKRTSLDEIYG